MTIDNPASGYGFADYMLGLVTRTQDAGSLAISQFRATSQAYFVVDTWKLRSNLTGWVLGTFEGSSTTTLPTQQSTAASIRAIRHAAR